MGEKELWQDWLDMRYAPGRNLRHRMISPHENLNSKCKSHEGNVHPAFMTARNAGPFLSPI